MTGVDALTAPGPLVLLFLVGVVAGIVNTLAGGGSLLTLPALMALGLSPTLANGTNRLAVLLQSSVSTGSFARHKTVPISLTLRLLPASLAGGILGAVLATRISSEDFRILLGIIFCVLGVLTVVRPRLLDPSPQPLTPPKARHHLLLFGAGLYGGFAQAGVGLLLLGVLGGALHLPLVRANAVKVSLVAAFTAASLILFGAAAQIAWGPGLGLALGSAVGGALGAKLNLKAPSGVLRGGVALVALVSGVKMLLP